MRRGGGAEVMFGAIAGTGSAATRAVVSIEPTKKIRAGLLDSTGQSGKRERTQPLLVSRCYSLNHPLNTDC